MITLMFLVILSSIFTSSSATAAYTTCMCNLNHPTCVQSQCTTDSQCQRVATVTTDRRIDYDQQFCISNATAVSSRCNSVFIRNSEIVEVSYCCNQRYCNGNDTFMFEIIIAYLGEGVLNLLTPTTTTATSTTITMTTINTTPTTRKLNHATTTNSAKTTSTTVTIADLDSDDNDVPYVPLIIALVVVVFVLIQVVIVTAVLLVVCLRLK